MSPRLLHYTSSLLILCCFAISAAYASPVVRPEISLWKRGSVIAYDDSGRIQNVTDSASGQSIAQSDATDASGVGLDVSAIIWLAWSFAVGVPMMLAGIRLGRVTAGTGVGLAVTVCLWASFINTLNASGISDIFLTIIVLVGFVLGFIFGLLNFGRAAGVTLLSILGGISIGVRIVLFRPNLLVSTYSINWVIATLCGVAGLGLIIVKQRAGIVIGSAAVGTFLVALGIDLAVNHQSGMSFGLRYLFDRNSAHLMYLLSRGWHPPVITEIIMAISLVLIPIFALGQHMFFRQPFRRVRSCSISSQATLEDEEEQTAEHDDATVTPSSFTEQKFSESDAASHPPPTPTSPVDPVTPSEDTPLKSKRGTIKKE